MKHILFSLAIGIGFLATAESVSPIDLMDLSNITTGWREVGVNRSAEGNALKVGGKVWERGLGVHAPSKAVFDLEGVALRFEATVGIDDESFGAVTFRVVGDGRELWNSGLVSARSKPRTKDVKVNLEGVQSLVLEVTDYDGNRDGDHADWLDAKFIFKPGAYGSEDPRQTSQLSALTPSPAVQPQINGAGVIGVRAKRPLLWHIPVTGEKPIGVSVANLPKGLRFNSESRILSGAIEECGDYPIEVTAKNAKGSVTKTVTVKVGSTIALTPAMGWDAAECFGGVATVEQVKAAADRIVSLGLADQGWSYIYVNDVWSKVPEKKAELKALADCLHAKGLKLGVNTATGDKTAWNGAGTWNREAEAAKLFASCGVDAVRANWSAINDDEGKGSALAKRMRPFFLMGRALAAGERNILFSFNQGPSLDVATWGRCVNASSWRVTVDTTDNWRQINGAVNQGRRNWYFSRPGEFNDFGPLRIGKWKGADAAGTRLTANEQYSVVSLAALLATPMTLVCDLGALDQFTLSLVNNREVIAINQDTLAAAASLIQTTGRGDVWARPLADGSFAIGLVNRDMKERSVAVDFAAIGLEGKWQVRDCWRQIDEGVAAGNYAHAVPGHATHLVHLIPQQGAKLAKGVRDIRDLDWLTTFNDGKKK